MVSNNCLSFVERFRPASKCKTATVTTLDGKDYQCLAYQIPAPFEEHPPSPHYMKVVVEGAIESGLPATYVDFLKGMQHNGDTTPPPIMKEIYWIFNLSKWCNSLHLFFWAVLQFRNIPFKIPWRTITGFPLAFESASPILPDWLFKDIV